MVADNRSPFTSFARTSLVYAVWAVFLASQIALLFWTHQIVVGMAIAQAAAVNNPWLPRTADMWSMLILGLVALVAIFSSEAALRKGMHNRRFWQVVARVALVEGLAALILLGLGAFF